MSHHSAYQAFWHRLHKNRHMTAIGTWNRVKSFVHHATFFTFGHGVCLLAYILPKKWAFQAASRLTCNTFHANQQAFEKTRLRFLGAGVITMATVSTGGMEMITDRVLSIFDPTHSLRASQTWDGHDHEVSIRGFGKGVRTDNQVDDINLVTAGAVATWQQLSDAGWELMLWTPQDPYPAQMTDDVYDDINPQTDGQYIAWQKKIDGQWAIYYLDVEESGRATKISGDGNASDMHMEDGVIVWQEWIDENWEIMMYRVGQGSRRITYNNTGDISPVIDAGVIFWEGIDPEGGDKEIFRYDVQTGVMAFETQNDRDDDAPTLEADNVVWFERGDVSQRVVHDDEDNQTTKTQLPPLPVILPEQTEPVVEAEATESGATEETAEEAEETTDETTTEEEATEESTESTEEEVTEEVVDDTAEEEETSEDVTEEAPTEETTEEEPTQEQDSTEEESSSSEEETEETSTESESVEEEATEVVEEPVTEESSEEETVVEESSEQTQEESTTQEPVTSEESVTEEEV